MICLYQKNFLGNLRISTENLRTYGKYYRRTNDLWNYQKKILQLETLVNTQYDFLTQHAIWKL